MISRKKVMAINRNLLLNRNFTLELIKSSSLLSPYIEFKD